MTYERIMGLHVTDDKLYSKYRNAMSPILEQFGGSFGYDFKISAVLKSKTEDPINRVFSIEFTDKETMDSFFRHAPYQEVRKRYLTRSVSGITTISLHTKDG